MARMSEKDLRARVTAQLQASKPSKEIVSSRQEGLKTYRGDTDLTGYEIRDGHSSVVSKNVMDTIEWMLPSLMKVFHGNDRVVEFLPEGDEDAAVAEQATEYVNFIYNRDNPGAIITYTWFKDALLQKVGIVKHWWSVEKKTETSTHSGLTDDDLTQLVREAEGNEEITIAEQRQDDGLWTVKLRRVYEEKKVRIEPVPPEEFRISRRAKSMEDADFIAHVTRASKEALLAQGFDKTKVEQATTNEADPGGAESATRYRSESPSQGPATEDDDDVTVAECFIRIDADGDDIAEWRKIVVTGEDGNGPILEDEEITSPLDFFSTLTPIPMPHTFWGMSISDTISDIQLVETTLLRQMLDNLYRTNNPMKKVRVDGLSKGCEGDVLVSRPDGLIRVDDMEAVQPMEVPFTAAASFPMLEYLAKKQEGRTGVSGATTAIDPDILKSHQTSGAVDRVLSNAQSRQDLVARIFAETGVKNMMRAILRLVVRYQDKQRMVRLNGEMVPIDPQQWNANMDVMVDVGLGTGSKEGLRASIAQMIQWQKEALTAPQLGLVTGQKFFNALDQFARASGFKSADAFYVDPSSPEGQQLQQQAAQAQQAQGGEAQVFLQAEQMKIQADMQKAQADRQLDLLKLQAQDDRERDKMEADLILRAAELELKGAQVNLQAIKQAMERERDLVSAFQQNEGPVQ